MKIADRKRSLLLAGAVALLTILVYLPALRNGFVTWDDPFYVTDNLHIRSLGVNFFRWAFLDFSSGNWHPLAWLSHALDYAVWGLNPFGHHLTSILIHATNAFLVVFLSAKLINIWKARGKGGQQEASCEGETLIAAGVAGLLFGLHPLHVESVVWVSERKDLLCTLFYLLSVIAYLSYGSAKDGRLFGFYRAYFLSLLLFLLALASKPMAVSLPLILLVLDWHPLGRFRSPAAWRRALAEKIPFLAASGFVAILTIYAQNAAGAMSGMQATSLETRIALVPGKLLLYLRKTAIPLHLSPFYPYPRLASLSTGDVFSFLLIGGFTLFSIMTARRNKLWLAAWSYFVITLLPVVGIVQVGGQAIAD